MRAIGIDPGTRHLGWGVVERHGNRLLHVAHGVIDLDGKASLAERLTVIDARLGALIELHEPGHGAVESLFYAKDPQAAAKLGHARGVVLLNLARRGLTLEEYAPSKVKATVAGRGQADKQQVGMMVRALLGLDELPRHDASDALALAVTHLRLAPLLEALAARAGATARGTPLPARKPTTGLPPALAARLAGRKAGRRGRTV